MTIKLTKEQMDEVLESGVLSVEHDNDRISFRLYTEISNYLDLEYIEVYGKMDERRIQTYALCKEELQLLLPKKPSDPSWYHNYPLCPNCGTYMIYKFENCPKCGQHLDWSGFTE